MKTFILSLILTAPLAAAFSVCHRQGVTWRHSSHKSLSLTNQDASSEMRRNIFTSAAIFTAVSLFQSPANAIPMITNDEFSTLMRDSSLSIQVVEFSGARSETVTVKLVDGTAFGIKDIIESSTDPRSPLKIAAECRENGVKTKFTDLESILANAPKKKKMYTNQRVQDAQEKEREKQERIQRDEEERIRELKRLEAEEAAAAAAAAANK